MDLILFGTVTSLETRSDIFSVDTDNIRRVEPALRDLGVDGELPWLEAVLATEFPETHSYQLVDTCPLDLKASNSRWDVRVHELPPLAVTLRPSNVVLGPSSGSLTFYVGWEERLAWSGPHVTGTQVEQDAELAPGTIIGVALTKDQTNAYASLASQVPFELDDGKIVVQTSCRPMMPPELNGMTIEALEKHLKACAADKTSVESGSMLHAARSASVSPPSREPHYASRCSITYTDKSLEEAGASR